VAGSRAALETGKHRRGAVHQHRLGAVRHSERQRIDGRFGVALHESVDSCYGLHSIAHSAP
jgi:hypothetical protein